MNGWKAGIGAVAVAGATVLVTAVPAAVEDATVNTRTMRQIFVDDHVIASMRGLSRVFHSPRRHPDNPILVGDRPWENWVIEVNGRPIVYDEQTAELRVYYVAPQMDPSAPAGERFRTCLAISRNGLRWQRQNLGQVEWEGSRDNNILRPGENWMRRPNVILDSTDPDPMRRYKMTFVDWIGDKTEGKTAIVKAYSRDGIEWTLNGDGRPWFRHLHSSNLLGWDPRIRKYVIYSRMAGPGNSIGRATSDDFVTWSEPELVIAPGPADQGRDFKGIAAFLYEGMYLGFLWVFDHKKSAEAKLVYSRDGIAWKRASPRRYYFPRGAGDAWDSRMVLQVAPVVFNNRIWVYYSGWNLPYSQAALARAHQGWFENGRRMQRAIGVATLRLDGFASLDAGAKEGVLVTKALHGQGGSLIVNADVRGELRVEVLDDGGTVLPGYGREECDPIRSDSTHHTVRWKSGARLDRFAGKAITLRFYLREGRVYSFAFSGSDRRQR
ncbi:MAG: hypothetical protein ACRD2X_09295 [Vicinamibacteraceae bacterium]